MTSSTNDTTSGFLKTRRICTGCLLQIILCFLSVPATAQAGDYTYTTANGQITITAYTGAGGAVIIPPTIDGLPVTSIGASAFNCLYNVTSVEIPSGVISIGQSAFAACGNLTSVTLPFTVTAIGENAFYYNAKLTSVNIPSGVLSLGNEVFTDCPALTNISIPASVTSMGTGMFQRCKALASASILASVTDIGTNAFNGCTSLTSVTLPPSLTSLPNYLFYSCTNLTSVSIPSGVTSIGDGAFRECSFLPAISIPSSVTKIGNYAFQNCRSMTTLTLLGGVQTIGFYAFSGCWKLTGVDFPAGLSSIEAYAFSDCAKLASITLPAGVTRIDNNAFFSCTSLANVAIPASVTSIGIAAFARCYKLSTFTVEDSNTNYRSYDGVLYDIAMTRLMTFPGARAGSFTIPDGVTTIDSMAFSVCGNLTGVTIPSSVTNIGEGAFSSCPLLENLTIPAAVTSIGSYAFLNCGKLSGVLFQGNVPYVGTSAFDSAASGFTIFYHQTSTGFTSPLWKGYPATALSTNQEIALKDPVGEILTDGGAATDFGYLLPGASSSKTFTIANAGSVPLTGISIGVDGSGAANFTVSTLTTPVLAPGSCAAFTVTFSPGAGGTKSASLHVASDDADENPFDIQLSGICTPTPVPEITVRQYGVPLEDGPGIVNVGSAEVGTYVVAGISITNSGTGDMHGFAITLDGVNAAEFSITTTPPAVLAPGASFSCVVGFSPVSLGTRTAQLHIASDDPDENPFDITVSGISKPPPSPEVAIEPSSGPVLTDGISIITFEPVSPGTQSLTKTFTIRNQGNAYLRNLAITKDGPNALEFVTSTLSKTTLLSGEGTTFTVKFTPSTVGTKIAVLHIQSNDADENPFDIQLSGASPGLTPEINVQMPDGTSLANGASDTSFGSVSTGDSEARVFTIINSGAATLTNLAFTVDGENAADFSASGPESTSILPGNAAYFTVDFTPGALGERNARLHIASNDSDENPFDIDLSGTGVPPTFPEIVVESPAGTILTNGVSSVSLGTLNFNSTIQKTFTVRNEGTANLVNLSVGLDGPDYQLFLAASPSIPELLPGESTTFNVTFQAKMARDISATLHIMSNDPDESPFEIPLSATVLALPPVQAEIDIQQPTGKSLKDGVSDISFGTVKIGSGGTKTFTIRNLGTGNLTVTSVKKTGLHAKDFVITPLVGTVVEPGAVKKLKVTFKPTANGLRKAAIHIRSNDGNETPFDIDLTGKGVARASASPALAGLAYPLSAAFHPAVKVFTARETVRGRNYLTLTVIKSPDPEFENPVVEVSSNLVDWYSGPRHTTVAADDRNMFVVRDNTPVTSRNKRHIRIKLPPASRDPHRAVRRP